jgi:GST-like protein
VHKEFSVIQFYFGPTPNSCKVSILIEELGLDREMIPMDILAGDQFKPSFLAINPNNKLPAIVDTDGADGWPITVWESGAILIYLAEKYRRFMPSAPRGRIECLKWLMFQMAGLGPTSGQFAFFNFHSRERLLLAIDRYDKELRRQMRVMNGHLERNEYFAGSEYGIADMAIYPWWNLLKGIIKVELPALHRWSETVSKRPAVTRGMGILTDKLRLEIAQDGTPNAMSDKSYSILYGEKQYHRH